MTNNEQKRLAINEIQACLQPLYQKLAILSALDDDSTTSGCGDLHNQLYRMTKALDSFEGGLYSASDIVPLEGKYLTENIPPFNRVPKEL
jgi:hypothetical protein